MSNCCSFYFILLCLHHLFQVNCTPCAHAPCFTRSNDVKTRHSHFNIKRNNLESRNKAGEKIPSSSPHLNMMSRDHIGFHRFPQGQAGIKMVPKVYMSTQRYPRGRPGSMGQLGTYVVTDGHIGAHVYRKGQVGIFKFPQEKTISSRNTITSPVSQSSDDMFRRGQALSPREQLDTRSLQTGDSQEQIMKNAQEYWWKSGYIEGQKRKLDNVPRISGFPSNTGLKGISAVKQGHLYTSKVNMGQARKAEVSDNQGIIGTIEGKMNTKTRDMGGSQDTNREQIRTYGNQMNTNIQETAGTRNPDSRPGTSRVQIGTLGSEGENKGHTGISQVTNAGQWRSTGGSNIRQARISVQVGNIGQSGTADGRSGISERQPKTSVDRNTGKWRSLEDRRLGQTRIRDGQSGTNRVQPGTTEIRMGTNAGQSRTSKGLTTTKTRETDGQMGTNTGESGALGRANIRQWRTFMDSTIGQTRTTEGQSGTTNGQSRNPEGQSGTSSGQSGTTDGQSGTTETSSENAVQQENAEISKNTPECSQPVDLAFLVDGSGSIDPFRQFPKVRKFLKELAAAFHVGPAKTKIALVQFSGKVSQKVEFGLNQYSDLKGIIEGIDGMQQLRGNTFVGEGFKVVSREIFSPEKGDRADVRNVLMLFTDGAATDFEVAKEEAKKLKTNGTTIICVGAGRELMLQFFRSQLQEFASDPPEQYVFTKGFEELDKVVKAVSSITCEEAKNAPKTATNTSVDTNLNSYKTADHYWAFDMVNGDIVTDLIGRKRCTLTGGAHLFMSVKRKMVCSMVESGGYLDFGSWASECITDPDLCVDGLTVTMWLRIQAKDINYNSEYQYIISSGAEGESMRGIVFLLKAKDEIYKLLVRTTGQAWSITLPADRIPSVWFSFAFAWKRSLGLAIYLNGFKVEENLKPTNVEGPDVSNSLFLARPATSTSLEYQTKFRIDDFAIFYRFMSDQEVQGILFEGNGPPSQGGADLCTPNPCKNGTCSTDSDTASGFVCQCLPGWTGELCNQEASGAQSPSQTQSSSTSTSGEQPNPGQGSQGTPGEPQNPSTSPNVPQGPGKSQSNTQGTPPSDSQSQGQTPPNNQNPSPPPSESQGPGPTPTNRPSGSSSETQGPGHTPPQQPAIITPPDASKTPNESAAQPPPKFSSTPGSGSSTTGPPTGSSPSRPGPQPPGESPTARPKECPPCPEKTTSNNSNIPGTSNPPGNWNPPGTSNPPGTRNPPNSNPSTPVPGLPQTSGTPMNPSNTSSNPQSTSSTKSSPDNAGNPQGNPGTPQETPATTPGTSSTPSGSPSNPQGSPDTPQGPSSSPQSSPNKPNIYPQSTSKTPGAPGNPQGSTSAPSSSGKTKCTPLPEGSKICSSQPSPNLADAAHTFRYRLPPVFGPYDTADDYDCTPQCKSDCTSGNCSEACCGSCPPVCRKVCRSDCPSRCCGKDAIIPQRRHAIPRPSRAASKPFRPSRPSRDSLQPSRVIVRHTRRITRPDPTRNRQVSRKNPQVVTPNLQTLSCICN